MTTSAKTLAIAAASLFFAALSAPHAAAQTTQTDTYTYTGAPIPILYSTQDAVVAELYVSRAVRVNKVTVRLQVAYPQIGDLSVFLYSANGTRTRLLEKNCGSLQNIDTTFDDAAPTRYSTFCPVEAGRGPFQGNEPLSNSNGESSLGIWRIAIQNTGSSNRTGVLQTFALTIAGTPVVQPSFTTDTIVSDSSGRSGFLAPGERIRIYGSGLGPDTPAVPPSGDAPNTLNGTTVVIDGIRVPILYTSANLVIVQVPYEEFPGTAAAIQIGYNGQTSGVLGLPVRIAKPGIYTTGANGRSAKAYGQNGQANSTDNPAPKGSYMTLYASGLGLTDPGINNGVVAPSSPLQYARPQLAAYIGGVQVPVTFAGLAPGLIGICQVNVQVLDAVPSGQQDIVLVSVNGTVSQQNVFVWIQ